MSENSDQDEKSTGLEFGTAPALSDDPASITDDANALSEIDQMLMEEDPEFLKQISEIKVDASQGNLSILDDVITNLSRPGSLQFHWKFHLQNLFFLENPRKFILFWALVILSVGMIFFGSKLFDLYFSKGLFLRSYAEWNSEIQSFNPMTDSEPFYDNPRFAKNLITLTKMVANVKSSESSGGTPMLAVELSVEGMSSDAIIEIKDREAEFKDILLRIAEEFSYDELIAGEGKKALLEKFTEAINANLSQGQVRRSLLKSFILKP